MEFNQLPDEFYPTPPAYGQKSYSEMSAEGKQVVDEYEG